MQTNITGIAIMSQTIRYSLTKFTPRKNLRFVKLRRKKPCKGEQFEAT